MRVRVYRNLHKKAYSVQDAATNRVIAVRDEVMVFDAVFRVGEKGRQRVIRDKQKNVHARVVGDVSNLTPRAGLVLVKREHLIKVSYNPYKASYFFEVGTDRPVVSAGAVFFMPDAVYATGVTYGDEEASVPG